MKTRPLGQTGLQVSELGLGGLFVSSIGGGPEQAREAVLRAVQLGVNFVDTAPTYANSEAVLGGILPNVKQPLILSTKLGGRPQPFEPKNRHHLRHSIEESLRLLGRETIDILMVHEPDRPGQYDWWEAADGGNGSASLNGPVLEVLDELKASGVVRFTGIGGTTAYEMVRFVRSGCFDVLLTAFNYSLLWREAEIELLPAAKAMKMGIVVGSPLQQGALAQRYDEEVEQGAPWLSRPRREQFRALYHLVDEIEIPLAELGLRFVLSNADVSTVLMGARSASEVEQNVAAVAKGPLPVDVLQRLNDIARRVPFRPFEEPFGLPFNRPYRGPGIA